MGRFGRFVQVSAKLAVVSLLTIAIGRFASACSSDDSPSSPGADAGVDGSGNGVADGSGGSNDSATVDGNSDGATPLGPDSVTGEQTATISAGDGGTITIEGASLVIPAGALSADTAITMRRYKNPLPPPINGYSPRYEFLPDGATFKKPLTLTIPFQGGADARVFWSTTPAGGWENRGGKINGSTITTGVTHFSSGGVGGTPVCPTQGGNTFCSMLGPSWNCCYGLDVDPKAESSYCYDRLHDDDHCGGCDLPQKCYITQYCQSLGGSSRCADCDPGNCLPP